MTLHARLRLDEARQSLIEAKRRKSHQRNPTRKEAPPMSTQLALQLVRPDGTDLEIGPYQFVSMTGPRSLQAIADDLDDESLIPAPYTEIICADGGDGIYEDGLFYTAGLPCDGEGFVAVHVVYKDHT